VNTAHRMSPLGSPAHWISAGRDSTGPWKSSKVHTERSKRTTRRETCSRDLATRGSAHGESRLTGPRSASGATLHEDRAARRVHVESSRTDAARPSLRIRSASIQPFRQEPWTE
jgi:hypothetical protein